MAASLYPVSECQGTPRPTAVVMSPSQAQGAITGIYSDIRQYLNSFIFYKSLQCTVNSLNGNESSRLKALYRIKQVACPMVNTDVNFNSAAFLVFSPDLSWPIPPCRGFVSQSNSCELVSAVTGPAAYCAHGTPRACDVMSVIMLLPELRGASSAHYCVTLPL